MKKVYEAFLEAAFSHCVWESGGCAGLGQYATLCMG